MKDLAAWVATCCAVVVILSIVSWSVIETDTDIQRVYAPQQEQIRRTTFEHSKAYQQGMTQQLEHEYLEYQSTHDNDSRQAIKSVVLHDFADYPTETLPVYLQQWLEKLRSVE